jgi:uroporphyrinogen decarboxylase
VELPVWYHSDGDISTIIEDLIEVGVTVLNPIQPECLDLPELARLYGDRLCFWGCIGTQSTMPWGSPSDVKAAVKHAIDCFAPGLVLAPTHVLEPEVPWENIVAFHEAVQEYGQLGG